MSGVLLLVVLVVRYFLVLIFHFVLLFCVPLASASVVCMCASECACVCVVVAAAAILLSASTRIFARELAVDIIQSSEYTERACVHLPSSIFSVGMSLERVFFLLGCVVYSRAAFWLRVDYASIPTVVCCGLNKYPKKAGASYLIQF